MTWPVGLWQVSNTAISPGNANDETICHWNGGCHPPLSPLLSFSSSSFSFHPSSSLSSFFLSDNVWSWGIHRKRNSHILRHKVKKTLWKFFFKKNFKLCFLSDTNKTKQNSFRDFFPLGVKRAKRKWYLYKDVWSREFGNKHALNKILLVDAEWVVPTCKPRYSESEAALKFKVSLDDLVGPCIKCINEKKGLG